MRVFLLLIALLLSTAAHASEVPGGPAQLALAPPPPQPIRLQEVQRHQRLARRGLAVALVANALEIPLLWSTQCRDLDPAWATAWGLSFVAGEVGLGMNAVGNWRAGRELSGLPGGYSTWLGTTSAFIWAGSWSLPLWTWAEMGIPEDALLGMILRVPLYWAALIGGGIQTWRNERTLRALTWQAPVSRTATLRVGVVAVPGGVGLRGVF